ncbi:MAG: methylated-DNA--[protein]-cysteine S-methyltransferase [Thiotrichaceae bacterium]
MELVAQEDALLSCQFTTHECHVATATPFLADCVVQLDAYFRGELQQFSLNLKPVGSAFAQQVWQQLGYIPSGKTMSYAEVAAAIAKPKAARAVGRANHHNPIAIIIPCHRVIAKQGNLSGYAYGVWRKAWLLAHEANTLNQLQQNIAN